MALGSVMRTSLSGLQAAIQAVQVEAHNVANARSVGFTPSRVNYAAQAARAARQGRSGNAQQIGQGVALASIDPAPRKDLARGLIDLTLAENSFRANLSTFDTAQRMLSELTRR